MSEFVVMKMTDDFYRKAKEKKELCVSIMGYGMKRGGIPQGGEKI